MAKRTNTQKHYDMLKKLEPYSEEYNYWFEKFGDRLFRHEDDVAKVAAKDIKKASYMNQADEKGNTIMHYACMDGRFDILQTQLYHFLTATNLFLKNNDGNTPLHELMKKSGHHTPYYALQSCYEVAARLGKINEKSANLFEKNNEGKDVLEILGDYKNWGIYDRVKAQLDKVKEKIGLVKQVKVEQENFQQENITSKKTEKETNQDLGMEQ